MRTLVGAVALGCSGTDIVGDLAAEGASAAAPDAAHGDAAHNGGAPIGCGAAVFAQALCACERVSSFGNLSATALDGAARAHVRIQGPLEAAGLAGPIAGDLAAVGAGVSVLSADDAEIAGSLLLTTDLDLNGVARVAGDARLAGALLGEGRLLVRGDLRSPVERDPASTPLRLEVEGARIVEPVAPEPPCGCAAGEQLPLRAWIEEARARNDNAARGFALDGPAAGTLALPPGRLFLEQLDAAGDLALEVHGATELFIADALRVPGALTAQLGPGATLTLIVGGGLELGGDLALAEPERAYAGRLYLAGELTRTGRPGGTAWIGQVYAPNAALSFSGHARVTGSLFVRSLVALGGIELRYDPRVVSQEPSQEPCDGP